MQSHILVLFGIITFTDEKVATVYSVENAVMLPIQLAQSTSDDLINQGCYDSYVIPQMYDGQIIFNQV